MFTGIGGFELGIQNVGTKPQNSTNTKGAAPQHSFSPLCVGYSEIDKYAIKVYERNFSGHRNYGDATKINAGELPDFDLLVGGFPCQAFSIAGKRAGFDDTRGTLFFDIARILKEKRPRHLVLENVKGLLSHGKPKGITFETIIGVLTDLGYCVEWQVLNSKDFGVPQNRERVYIVGHLGNECRGKVFSISGNDSEDNARRIDSAGINNPSRGYEIRRDGLASSLRATEMGSKNFIADIRQLNNPVHSNDRVYDTSGVSPTLNTMQGGNRQPFIAAQRGRGNGQVLEPQLEDKSNTLTAVAKDNYVVDVPRIRRLTPLECERLQGFPDNWTEGESDTQRYKMCGNAVTVNVVEAVMKSLMLHSNIN